MADLSDSRNLEVPRNIHLNERQNSLEIEYSWFKLKYLFFLFITPICSYVIVESEYVEGSLDDITLPVVLIAVANIALIYYCLTRLLNTTIISVNKERIQIKHRPLPLVKDFTIKRKDLAQLYVTKQMRAKRYDFYSVTYHINAILADKHAITILKGLHDPRQGRFIEHKIEEFLGITDVAVDGEIEKE